MKTITKLFAVLLVSAFAVGGAAYAYETSGLIHQTQPGACQPVNGRVIVTILDRNGTYYVQCNNHDMPGMTSGSIANAHPAPQSAGNWHTQQGGNNYSARCFTPGQCPIQYTYK